MLLLFILLINFYFLAELNQLLAQEVVPHHISLRFPSVELLQEQKIMLSKRLNQLKYAK